MTRPPITIDAIPFTENRQRFDNGQPWFCRVEESTCPLLLPLRRPRIAQRLVEIGRTNLRRVALLHDAISEDTRDMFRSGSIHLQAKQQEEQNEQKQTSDRHTC